ncbi:MAG: beta-lactamase family protein, partial [Halioglobus sp.]|nr:beta-lactamase family protein [Halioglobus sp.]
VHLYLPDLRGYGAPVTIRQMVHHVAGMGDYDADLFRKADGGEFRFGNEDYWTIAEFYKAVRDVPLRYAPGRRWEYSNLGYFLLSQVVERVSGMSLRQYADGNMFAPLGMSHTMFYDNVNEPVKHRADGYRKTDAGDYELYMTNLSWVGDGGIYTTLDDFIHWDRNWTNNRLGKGGTDLIELVTTPLPGFRAGGDAMLGDRQGYAFGLFVSEGDGPKIIGHTGGWVG